MKIIIEIEVDKEVWKQAICMGWKDEHDEMLVPSEIKNLASVEDVQRAIGYIQTDCIKKVIM